MKTSWILIMIIGNFVLFGCKSWHEGYIPVSTIQLNIGEINLLEGETIQLQAQIIPSNATDQNIMWGSSKPSVASVSATGMVTALGDGKATVIASTGGLSATCDVIVNKAFVGIESIGLNQSDILLIAGQSVQLVVTIFPEEATDKAIIWSTTNSSVVTVNELGELTAISPGTANVSVITLDGSKSAVCKVTVIENESENETETEAENGHQWVDLGLPSQVKWASCNVGANTPEGSGNLYAWGEVKTKKEYDWSSYNWCDSNETSLTKYNTLDTYGPLVDNIITLEVKDDVAQYEWGGEWRMPTNADFEELIDITNCSMEWTTLNGVKGRRIISNKNGNSIFLPAVVSGYYGYYWSSSLYLDNPSRAWILDIGTANSYIGAYTSQISRCLGRSVRPVIGYVGDIAVTNVSINKDDIELEAGETEKLIATVSPSNATNKGIIWASSNNKIASVTSAGVVSAKSIGTATITATTADGNMTAFCLVTVSGSSEWYGTDNGHEWVDLGLPSGLRWATCNVGALTSESYGDHFAWGETAAKTNFVWSTYKWCNSSGISLTKYNTNLSYGSKVDNKTALDLTDDAARIKWGGKWRMPTKADFEELISIRNCTTELITQNGVKGFKITSNRYGNSIFLPAAGYGNGTIISNPNSYGYYWSSTLLTEAPSVAWYVLFNSSTIVVGANSRVFSRYDGFSIRPVRE